MAALNPWAKCVVDSCLDFVGDLFFAVAAVLFLQLSDYSIYLREFCSQKMMAMGLMLPSCMAFRVF